MRNILVTGTASGLGRELALMYAKQGCKVYGLDVDKAKLDTLPKENIIPIQMDIANSEQWDTLALPAIEKAGEGLDVVVACAAVMRVGSVEDCTLETWNFVNNVNLTAQFLTAQKTMKYLKQTKGNILFIGSPSAKLAVRDEVCYVTFKHAICGLSKSVAFDYGEAGVRSNVLHPGWMRTAMSDMEMQEIMDRDNVSLDEAYATVTRFVPLKRPASLDEVCKAASYLTSIDASYITGAELMVDGGLTIVDPGMIGFL
jgi:NAD(P)-dependent dehydrogenase (short-subunit alcohol dehydrogenase family)